MNILVTGASGLLGTAIVSRLQDGGNVVAPLRRAAAGRATGPTWNPAAGQVLLDPAFRIDAVVHLAGENIAQRWTAKAKARIRASRVEGTRLLSEALARAPQPPRVMVCASATGIYGDRGEEILEERSLPGIGFLAEVCQAWEAATAPARQRGIRVVHLRLGIVLARQGGALAKMLPAFRLGLGGRLGSGQQVLELGSHRGRVGCGGVGTLGRGPEWSGEHRGTRGRHQRQFHGGAIPSPAATGHSAGARGPGAHRFRRNGPGGFARELPGASGASPGGRI